MTEKKKTRTKKLEKPIIENCERIDMVHRIAQIGGTDKEISFIMGISQQTLDNYKNDNPEFFQDLKDSKAGPDKHVIASLYKLATGFYVDTVRHISVSDGMQAGSHIESVEEREFIKPNVTACIFWLKNRQPRLWRDKQEHIVNSAAESLSDSELEKLVFESIMVDIKKGEKVE